MNVTAPRTPMDYFFEHHSATMVFFVHEGGGTLETTFGPIGYGQGRLPHRPQGRHAPLRARRRAPSTTGCTRASRAIPRSRSRPRPASSSRTAGATTGSPARWPTMNERGASRSCPRSTGFTRGASIPRILRRHRLARRLPAVQVRGRGRAAAGGRPLARAALRPHDLQAARMLPLRLHRALRGEGRDVAAFFHKNLDYLRDARLPLRRLLQRRRRGRSGMVIAAPGGPAPRTQAEARWRRSWTGAGAEVHNEVGVMADFANPARSPTRAGAEPRRLHERVGGYTTAPRFAYAPGRLAEVRAWPTAWPARATRCDHPTARPGRARRGARGARRRRGRRGRWRGRPLRRRRGRAG